MKNLYLPLSFLLFSAVCFAQNLVPNPSFEQYDTCPNSFSQIYFATGWWSAKESPDYFNECATGIVDMPNSAMGFQEADSGTAYAGIQIYSPDNYVNEILSTELVSKMKEGYYYKVGFVTNRADALVFFAAASNNLGVLFSTIRHDLQNPYQQNNFSHFKIDSVVTDTANWLNIEFNFQSDSEYKYMMIGNFYSNDLTDTIKFINGGSKPYYFIDNVYVIEDTSNAINKLLSNKINTYFNKNNQLIVENAQGSDIEIVDNNGATIFKKNNIQEEKYIVEIPASLVILIVVIAAFSFVIYYRKHINQ